MMSSGSLVRESPAPLIAIVILSHDRPDTLAEALASVRAQTFTDYEIFVVSNGESDGMRQQTWAAADAHRAQYFALDKGSVSIARNLGLAKARGEWIAFLDDDDVVEVMDMRRRPAYSATHANRLRHKTA
jgi:glycosyltransferase involved in cell wall biosynthesis